MPSISNATETSINLSDPGPSLTPGQRSVAALILLALAAIIYLGLMIGALLLMFKLTGLGAMPAITQRKISLGFAVMLFVVAPLVTAISRVFVRAARTV